LKVLNEAVPPFQISKERFRREAVASARLSHPNVLRVFDAGEEGGRFFLVMELVKGESLSKVIGDRRYEIRPMLEILRKVALGVQHAHEQDVVHRDLKPANILVEPEGEPKVVDFGLAYLGGADTQLTRSGAIMGTPVYMAPEQVRGDRKKISARTDVYALGAILYEVLTGRPPHMGGTAIEVYQRITWDEPISPRKLNARVPADVETIAFKALEKGPSRRYASAKEFADDLGRFLRGEPIVARPSPFYSRIAKRIRRHAAASVAAATVAVTLLTAAGVVIAGRIRRANEMDRLEREADKADPDTAIVLWAQLQSMGHPAAWKGIEAARRRRAREQIKAARRHLLLRDDAYERAGRHVRERDAEIDRKAPYWSLDDRRKIWDAERRHAEAQLDASVNDTRAEHAAQTALHYSDEPEARRLLASIYFRRWRDAEERRNAAEMKLWGPLVVQYGGREFQEEIEKPATIRLTASGATAYLFRYQEHERRVVPVPWGGPAPEWPSVAPVKLEFRHKRVDGRLVQLPFDPSVATPEGEPIFADAPEAEKDAARKGTAYPLACGSANEVTFPLQIPAGSWLVLLRWPGKAEVRYPLWIARGEVVEARVEPPDDVPEGFVYVPPGPAIVGQDPFIITSLDRKRNEQKSEIKEFFIARFEVTLGQYYEYIQDTKQQLRWPMDVAVGDYPVCAVSWNEAVAYADWCTRKKGGGRWTFRLPTHQEWEKAARGADGRFHVWGDGGEGMFYTSQTARGDRVGIEPIGLFPADESPFGVRDMAGGRREWTASFGSDGSQRIVKGGAYGAFASSVRAAFHTVAAPHAGDITVGFRLAADRIK
ncbi:MAG: SUMF1/EgtB/PvdO family nonheme iron enzyme, partial [Planctomycetes bacterium]|nr:SUMF1/EgtB/PvdO family nonheme iron enzyme [Planctomycetota bacterium]